MRTLGYIRETLPIKKFGSYIMVKERCVAVSQAKIFCSDALTQQFFPTAAIFASLCTQTVVLWELVMPLEQRYLTFPTKSLIHRELTFSWPCVAQTGVIKIFQSDDTLEKRKKKQEEE